MKKNYASFLLTLICFLGLGASAQAQSRGDIVVTLPFEFVVSGKILPAGTYTLSRFSDHRLDGLLLFNRQNHISIFVHPVEVKSASADKPQVSFERVGEQRFLTRIETTNYAYEIDVPRSVIMEAAARPHESGSTTVSSGKD